MNMQPRAIIRGNPQSILQLSKAPLRNPPDWTQMDSDILAHFAQVNSQIQNSRWFKSEIRYKMQDEKLLDYSFPDIEDFVFAAVYIRQLIAENDSLLDDAIKRYCQHVDCPIRPSWVRYELMAFNATLNQCALNLPVCTVRELFDAFMYGAGLLHKIPKVGNHRRVRFLEIYDNQPKQKLFYSLNMSLKLLMNHVNRVSAVIYRDYSNWLQDYELPSPDTRWHDQLFKI